MNSSWIPDFFCGLISHSQQKHHYVVRSWVTSPQVYHTSTKLCIFTTFLLPRLLWRQPEVCARNVPPSVRPSPTLVWTHPPGSVTSASKKLINRKLLRHTHTYTHTYLCYFGVSPGLLAKMLLRRMMTTAATCLWNISKALWLMSHRYIHTTPIHILLMVVICSLPFSPSLPLTPFPSPSPSHIPQAPSHKNKWSKRSATYGSLG